MTVARRLCAVALAVLAFAVGLSACDGATTTEPPPPPPPGLDDLALVQVASGLNFPVHLTSPPGDARLFVVEISGQISIIENDQLLGTPFLDIANDISSGGEQGLLSMAFHPNYSANGFFYVFYTEDINGDTRVERYMVSGDPNVADVNSASEIITVSQPFGNHNGGLITFGTDGMLYIGFGRRWKRRRSAGSWPGSRNVAGCDSPSRCGWRRSIRDSQRQSVRGRPERA